MTKSAHKLRSASSAPSRHLCVERLEDRLLLAVNPMTQVEQHLHELVNWVRTHPVESSQRYNTPLNQGLPAGTISTDSKPPLARNDQLRDAMQGHLEDMQQNNFFSHTGTGGSTFDGRITAAGYPNWAIVGENIAWWGTTGVLDDLFAVAEELVDGWFKSPGHRANIYRVETIDGTAIVPGFKEVGTSFITGRYAPEGTTFDAGLGGQDFGARLGVNFLTGVGCYTYRTDLGICDVTHPVIGATVAATRPGTQLSFQTQTGATGEYDLQLSDGPWEVRISGGGMAQELAYNIVIADNNVKIDFTPAVATPWTNPVDPLDVNNDTFVTPNDALVLINKMNSDGAGPLPVPPTPTWSPPPYYDTGGDNFLSPSDVLRIVNFLNGFSSGEGNSLGEGVAATFQVGFAQNSFAGLLDPPSAEQQPSAWLTGTTESEPVPQSCCPHIQVCSTGVGQAFQPAGQTGMSAPRQSRGTLSDLDEVALDQLFNTLGDTDPEAISVR